MAAASEARRVTGATSRASSAAPQGEDATSPLLLLNASAVAACLWAASLADVAAASTAAGDEGAASGAWGRFWEQARLAGQLWGQLLSQRAAAGGREPGGPLLRHVDVCLEALTRLHQLCYLHGMPRGGLCCSQCATGLVVPAEVSLVLPFPPTPYISTTYTVSPHSHNHPLVLRPGDKDLQSVLEASLAHIVSANGSSGSSSSRLRTAWAVAGSGTSCLQWAVAAQPCASLGEAIGAGLPSGASTELRAAWEELGQLR